MGIYKQIFEYIQLSQNLRMNIWIYSYWGICTNTNTNNIWGQFYSNIRIFEYSCSSLSRTTSAVYFIRHLSGIKKWSEIWLAWTSKCNEIWWEGPPYGRKFYWKGHPIWLKFQYWKFYYIFKDFLSENFLTFSSSHWFPSIIYNTNCENKKNCATPS